MGELSILGRELAGAWRARAPNVVLRHSQVLEDGPGAGCLDTIRLCPLCKMGQRDTDSDWISQSGMTLRDVEIICDVVSEVYDEANF